VSLGPRASWPRESPRIEAGPFRLRPFDERDLPLVEEASRDPFIPLITTVPAVYTPEEAEAFLQRQRDRVANREGYPCVIVDPTEARGIGAVGVWLRHADLGRASFGYWVAPSERGRSAARHGLAALTVWTFATFGIPRLELYVEPWNTASIKTAEGAGFRREGLLRSWETVGSERRDMFMYSPARDGSADVGSAAMDASRTSAQPSGDDTRSASTIRRWLLPYLG
jgi:RimJ/RimL family protein N-acetyltransferase